MWQALLLKHENITPYLFSLTKPLPLDTKKGPNTSNPTFVKTGISPVNLSVGKSLIICILGLPFIFLHMMQLFNFPLTILFIPIIWYLCLKALTTVFLPKC